jgi:hypothetical protein
VIGGRIVAIWGPNETIEGEELVLELCRPFLGCRIDEYDAWDLKMELFRES